MQVFEAAQVREALDAPGLIEALRAAFREGAEVPLRHHHTLAVPGEPAATLLLMPAWTAGGFLGVKIAGVFPGNAARGQPAVQAQYLLMNAGTGEPLALLDGNELTARRTAAASALAAGYLARRDAARLLVVATGRLAVPLACAHAGVRDYAQISVWGRDPAKAGDVAGQLRRLGLPADAAVTLEAAVRSADTISCATLSTWALIRGDWLAPGTHLDLVGGYTPAMREADDAAIARAEVFVDTRAGALVEAGDLVQPLASGVLRPEAVLAELAGLCRGEHPGRRDAAAITVFKSVGTALEDLAAAVLVWQRRALPGCG
ncbi:ornithine cyclodeaminase family protein [Plasticicumulans sp.]|uniref:ornithine cyclodeaminase family protein n=1 Tax=Plasticicumulans sp. TaxID=2307179 RepID=UPI002BE578D8|nr:ornithine cyclodeaminase family protein [Plasticicumulans sp.]HNM43909.1 ornithine cyclodeaminase family protein [Plasticicumulans sp.]